MTSPARESPRARPQVPLLPIAVVNGGTDKRIKAVAKELATPRQQPHKQRTPQNSDPLPPSANLTDQQRAVETPPASTTAAQRTAGQASISGRLSYSARELSIGARAAARAFADHHKDVYDKTTILTQAERLALPKVLAKRPQDRTEAELQPVLKVLQKIDFLAELDGSVQRELAQFAGFAAYKAGCTVFKQGDPGRLFYIIASGRVAVQVLMDDVLTTARVIEAGCSFGELALLKPGGTRAATIQSVIDCEFLTVDGEQYEQLLARVHRDEIRAKVAVIQNASIFRDWPTAQLEQLALVLQLRHFPSNTTVVKQGSTSDAMYFIKRGAVRIVRRMQVNEGLTRRLHADPLLSARIMPQWATSKRHQGLPWATPPSSRSAPCSPRHPPMGLQTRPQPRSAAAEDVCVEVMRLRENQSFGELAALNGTCRQASVITDVSTELLVLTRHDLLSQVSGIARANLEALKDSYTGDDVMLRAMEDNLRWERYKSDLVSGILWGQGRQDRLIEYTQMQSQHINKPRWRG